MRLLLLTALTMIAFAANSVLNRTALEGGDIDALSFAALRVTAGVVVLMLLVLMRHDTGKIRGAFDLFATIGLLAYMLGFSFAYNSLDTGLGALILFGGVQITMFAGAVLFGKKPVVGQWDWRSHCVFRAGVFAGAKRCGTQPIRHGRDGHRSSWLGRVFAARGQGDRSVGGHLCQFFRRFAHCFGCVAVCDEQRDWPLWRGIGDCVRGGYFGAGLCAVVSGFTSVADCHRRSCATDRSDYCGIGRVCGAVRTSDNDFYCGIGFGARRNWDFGLGGKSRVGLGPVDKP